MRRLLVTTLLCLAGCAEERSEAPVYGSAAVERRTIEVSVGSAGVVEPLTTVEVKSKASGEVLELFVETGDYVEEGALMVRIDPRTVRNRLAQAEAELKAALSRRTISRTQMERAEALVTQGTFTRADYEQAALELANAEAQVVSAEVAVENARIAVDDTDVRAAVAGTIIDKPVEKGQVISSPTQDFGGGTLLLRMADLSAVQIRALIDETDIGKVRAGMPASVTVAAYPNQPFTGEVIKIEPQALVEQNVTMFPVIVSIGNPEGLLMPGMNAEVEISIAKASSALTVPVGALRTDRDVVATAGIIGMSESALRARLDAQKDDAGGVTAEEQRGATLALPGRTIELPPGVEPDAVQKAMEKRRSGASLSADEQALLRSVFAGGGRESARPEADYRFGGSFWVVVEAAGGSRDVRVVRTGITDLDRVEIVEGLAESDRVLILPSAHLVETQEQLQQFINRRVGGVPGIGTR
ncbi:MAG: efflux RND transporter periplasmic adaptor subunit [Gammaproteobacteria bacterium]|nr:efflux RND transporter periplasmic adaptor subunit [Gammaproteobacteria bacterium]MDH4255037.1 efflux RND transporter periplasmic adaptor subunit [Gammaproteobacteria bacterium]MDH5309262.1 efflux RND transporter periplasmic adaptor subunit [Gammaproteobacteria bacterium]